MRTPDVRIECLIAIKMHISISSQQNNLVYALWQEVPKLVYTFWTYKPVIWNFGGTPMEFLFLFLELLTFDIINCLS